jgi:hypothetical protein
MAYGGWAFSSFGIQFMNKIYAYVRTISPRTHLYTKNKVDKPQYKVA